MTDYSREQMVILYVIKNFKDLTGCEESEFQITENGDQSLGDFVPTDEEIYDCLAEFIQEFGNSIEGSAPTQ